MKQATEAAAAIMVVVEVEVEAVGSTTMLEPRRCAPRASLCSTTRCYRLGDTNAVTASAVSGDMGCASHGFRRGC